MDTTQEAGLSIFTNEEFGQVRVIVRDGEPWFVASDVAKALGYAIPRKAVSDHCKYTELLKGSDSDRLTGSPRGINIIPEADVYALIFRSNLPRAEAFRDWVCREVLPSLRKTGKYEVTPTTPAPSLPDFSNPAAAARAWADEYEAKMLAQKQVVALTETVEEQEIALSLHRDWKTVAGIPWLKDYFISTDSQTLGRIGKLLTRLCREEGIGFKSIPDDRWGVVNSYPVHIIDVLKKKLDEDANFLSSIRK